jgi:mono/diheme cytochrome c family protein
MKSLRTPVVPALVLLFVSILVVLPSAGCSDRDRNMAVDTTALAASMITPETFDTIRWPSDSAAVARGAVVWTYSCRKCHGDWGQGDGVLVARGDVEAPPSFQNPEWRFANDRPGMRDQVFTGTNKGMPHWGMVGLTSRDIDAVSLYVQKVLRADS